MQEIVKRNLPIVRGQLSRDEAEALFASKGQNFKVELIRSFPGTEPVGTFTQGEFTDLCKGPHVDRTGKLKHVRLMSIAGAYWRGDAKNEQLQRIYGTVFPTAEELKQHLERLEQAKARDHRKLGKRARPLHVGRSHRTRRVPSGTRRARSCATRSRTSSGASCCPPRATRRSRRPSWRDKELLETSGHWAHYQEDMFLVPEKNDLLLQASGDKETPPTGQDEKDERTRLLAVKPMNCPFHATIYKSGLRSYRELPIRFHELGTVYRYELSGVLHGLLRVRGSSRWTMGTSSCATRTSPTRSPSAYRFSLEMLKLFGFEDFNLYLATRPESFLGEPAAWDKAESALRAVLESLGRPFEVDAGRGLLRAEDRSQDQGRPRARVPVLDVPARLPDPGSLQPRVRRAGRHAQAPPIMIHRALLRVDRALHRRAHRALRGRVPAVAGTRAGARAFRLREGRGLRERGGGPLEAGGPARRGRHLGDDKLGAKIRRAQVEKIPYMVVVGEGDRSWPRAWFRRAREKVSNNRRRRSTSARDASRRKPWCPWWAPRAKIESKEQEHP